MRPRPSSNRAASSSGASRSTPVSACRRSSRTLTGRSWPCTAATPPPARPRRQCSRVSERSVDREKIYRSRDTDVEVPSTDVASYVLEGAAERGDKPALIDGPTGRELTHGGLAELVGRLAAGL